MNDFYSKYGQLISQLENNKADMLCEYLIEALENGVILSGTMVPTQRFLSNRLHIGLSCVSRACISLRNRGYIVKGSNANTYTFSDRELFANSSSMYATKGHPVLMAKSNRKKSMPGHMKYLNIGRTAINPSLVVQAKPNPVQKVIQEVFNNGVNFWISYKDNNRNFLKHVAYEVVQYRRSNINLDQLALGVTREAVLNDIASLCISPGDGVLLNVKADRKLLERLEKEGACLFFLKEDYGICTQELTRLVAEHKENNQPINYLYTNLFHDSYADDAAIYQRMYELIHLTKELGICLILEFSEDIFLEQPVEFLLNNRLVGMDHLICIMKLSNLAAEMSEIQVLMGPTDFIKEFERIKYNKVYSKGLTFFILEQLKRQFVVEDFLPVIVGKLQKWREDVVLSAALLGPWFEVKKSQRGSSIWLVARGGRELIVPIAPLLELDIAVSHSWVDYEDVFPIQAIKVGLGYGETAEIHKAFGLIRDYLIIHYPM